MVKNNSHSTESGLFGSSVYAPAYGKLDASFWVQCRIAAGGHGEREGRTV